MVAGRASAHRLIVVWVAAVALALAGCGSSSSRHSARPSATAATVKTSPTPTPPVTFTAKYASIRTGMTLDQVRAVMGSSGQTTSESDDGRTTSIVVQWQDPKTSHAIIVAFINNIAQSKSAIGF